MNNKQWHVQNETTMGTIQIQESRSICDRSKTRQYKKSTAKYVIELRCALSQWAMITSETVRRLSYQKQRTNAVEILDNQ